MEELYEAGGVPAVMKELAPLLHRASLTVTGKTIGENLQATPRLSAFVRSLQLRKALRRKGLAIVRGNLAPSGAVIKQRLPQQLLQHRGRAVVFALLLEDLAAARR